MNSMNKLIHTRRHVHSRNIHTPNPPPPLPSPADVTSLCCNEVESPLQGDPFWVLQCGPPLPHHSHPSTRSEHYSAAPCSPSTTALDPCVSTTTARARTCTHTHIHPLISPLGEEGYGPNAAAALLGFIADCVASDNTVCSLPLWSSDHHQPLPFHPPPHTPPGQILVCTDVVKIKTNSHLHNHAYIGPLHCCGLSCLSTWEVQIRTHTRTHEHEITNNTQSQTHTTGAGRFLDPAVAAPLRTLLSTLLTPAADDDADATPGICYALDDIRPGQDS